MGLRLALIIAALLGSPSLARAESWYFEWRCAGACAPDRLDVRGREGPFDSERGCDSARSNKLQWALGPGSAGSATSCFDTDAGGTPGTSGGFARAARLARVFLGITTGAGYQATYDNGRVVRSTRQLGGELELAFGADRLGLAVVLGVDRDTGTSPDAAMPAGPMWLVELGVGLVSSPFAVIRRGSLEVRPELGAYIFDLERVGCTRCDADVIAGTPGEVSGGFGGRLRAGVDLYFGRKHVQGVAIEALFQFVKLGDFTDATAPTSVELVPPRLLVRLSWIPYRNP
ncbi:MAG: hypothetical protein H6Q90_3452 [Deltaproteobacteria bacterium]|nr:hypothetical protein [Deltaproteobacteria bacterium]